MAGSWDVIVLGVGSMGSAACQHLASRGLSVLGIEAFRPGHDLGSGHGRTRMIRQAYAESPAYIPLVLRAYELWRELEAATGRDLLTITGAVFAGPPGSWAVEGAATSAAEHGLPFERLDAAEVNRRFPAFALSDEMTCGLEPRAGFLHPDGCIAAAVEVAERHGAELRWNERVLGWRADGDGVVVETAAGTYRAGSLVVTAGPWTPEVLAGLDLPLEVWRVFNVWMQPSRPADAGPDRLPCFLLDLAGSGEFYGFPDLPGEGVKVGRHDQGLPTTAAAVDRVIRPEEAEAVRAAVARVLPGAAGPVTRTKACMYTMTPDGHFIVDRHPEHPRVVYACGFSGHGFKFSNAIGEALAGLVIDGRAPVSVDFLSAARFSTI
jgi:sarcosine oxidase